MTNDTRRVIEARLNSIKTEFNIAEISYRLASEDRLYPHIVWNITGITPADMGREDFSIEVDVWTKDQAQAFDIAEAVKELFCFWNAPNADILPTFYEENTITVEDPDKSIIHVVVRLTGHVYDAQNQGGNVWQQ